MKGAGKGMEIPCFMWPWGETSKVCSAGKTKEVYGGKRHPFLVICSWSFRDVTITGYGYLLKIVFSCPPVLTCLNVVN